MHAFTFLLLLLSVFVASVACDHLSEIELVANPVTFDKKYDGLVLLRNGTWGPVGVRGSIDVEGNFGLQAILPHDHYIFIGHTSPGTKPVLRNGTVCAPITFSAFDTIENDWRCILGSQHGQIMGGLYYYQSYTEKYMLGRVSAIVQRDSTAANYSNILYLGGQFSKAGGTEEWNVNVSNVVKYDIENDEFFPLETPYPGNDVYLMSSTSQYLYILTNNGQQLWSFSFSTYLWMLLPNIKFLGSPLDCGISSYALWPSTLSSSTTTTATIDNNNNNRIIDNENEQQVDGVLFFFGKILIQEQNISAIAMWKESTQSWYAVLDQSIEEYSSITSVTAITMNPYDHRLVLTATYDGCHPLGLFYQTMEVTGSFPPINGSYGWTRISHSSFEFPKESAGCKWAKELQFVGDQLLLSWRTYNPEGYALTAIGETIIAMPNYSPAADDAPTIIRAMPSVSSQEWAYIHAGPPPPPSPPKDNKISTTLLIIIGCAVALVLASVIMVGCYHCKKARGHSVNAIDTNGPLLTSYDISA
eukprot:TRINITY_DN1844_c2_g1_i1.p1 TRINITY_DN1844_c2_g1~~TRINITY_DN1844_c2_g1_i1.p1  ORF type:complete len:530 (+),score=100.83 TRINITY_DN1844_c2_g1_i1:50-1639(+)